MLNLSLKLRVKCMDNITDLLVLCSSVTVEQWCIIQLFNRMTLEQPTLNVHPIRLLPWRNSPHPRTPEPHFTVPLSEGEEDELDPINIARDENKITGFALPLQKRVHIVSPTVAHY